MLALSKDITLKEPKHPQEEKDAKLKDYMDYQRNLNNVQIVYHSLKHAKTKLEQNLEVHRKNPENLSDFIVKTFPFSHRFADPKTLLLMLKKLIMGHNTPKKWYRVNSYFYALIYDCLKEFIVYYNRLISDSPENAKNYTVSHGRVIDFDDWVYLFFPDLDFHLGNELKSKQYPLAQRNKVIEEDLAKESENGCSKEEALKKVQKKFEIDDCSIKILLGKKISNDDLELFHTSMDNPIYEFLTQKMDGSWDSIDGESLMDQAYTMGSQLKVTVWKRRKKGNK